MIKSLTFNGLFWIGGLKGSIRILSLVRLGIIARILSPYDFGYFGVTAIVLALLEILTETGINIFFIQKEGKIEDYLDTAFSVSILRGILIALIMYFSAGIIARFFNIPDVYLLIQVMSIAPILRGFINPAIVTLQKELLFKKEFWLRISATLADIISSVFVTLITRSAMGLVVGIIVGIVFELILSHLLIKPRPKIIIEKSKFVRVVDRGKWVTIAGFFQYLFTNIDNVVAGKIAGSYALGLYQNAYKVSVQPLTEMAEIFNRVAFPIYAKLANNRKILKTVFIKYFIGLNILVIPTALIISLFSRNIVELLFGDKWISIVPAVRIFGLVGAIKAIQMAVYPLFLSLKKQEYIAKINFISILGLMMIIYPLTVKFGIIGTVYAASIGIIIGLFPTSYFLYYKTDLLHSKPKPQK